MDFKFKVGVGSFLLNPVELHPVGSFPSLWPAAVTATSGGGLPTLPCSTLMRTELGFWFPSAGWCLDSAGPGERQLAQGSSRDLRPYCATWQTIPPLTSLSRLILKGRECGGEWGTLLPPQSITSIDTVQ